VTVFEEYKKHQISGESVSGPSPTEAKRDKLEVVRSRDTETIRGKPAGTKGTNFKPPTGSWEESVQRIDACEERDGSVKVYLTWKGGEKTLHTLGQVYERCPQKVRQYKSPLA